MKQKPIHREKVLSQNNYSISFFYTTQTNFSLLYILHTYYNFYITWDITFIIWHSTYSILQKNEYFTFASVSDPKQSTADGTFCCLTSTDLLKHYLSFWFTEQCEPRGHGSICSFISFGGRTGNRRRVNFKIFEYFYFTYRVCVIQHHPRHFSPFNIHYFIAEYHVCFLRAIIASYT